MKTNNILLFKIKDTGIGIPEEKIKSLFDKFYQVDSSYTKKYMGAGLGLAISKQLVELMGGNIWVKSKVKEGSTFYFTLKADIPKTDMVEEYKASAESSKILKTKQNLNILLAEDDMLNSKTIIYFLKKEGHRVKHATNGIKVLSMLENETFDIILMDIQMPEMDGIEATKKIRNSDFEKFDPEIPIIALTAYAMSGDKEIFLNSGMDDYATKPVKINDLIAKINNLTDHEKKTIIPLKKTLPVDSDSKSEINGFIKATNKNPELQKELLNLFLESSQKMIKNLETAIFNNDINQVAFISHKITGIFGAIRAFSAAKYSQLLESDARSGKTDRFNNTFQYLKNLTEQINIFIKSHI